MTEKKVHAAMREIVFDTETTGLDALQGDRVVEIGCVELVNRFPTGKTFHVYINPERDMPEGAFRVHGLSSEFLKDKPVFADIADDFLTFVGDATLVAHNAAFDLGFINAELDRLEMPALPRERLLDTLLLARRKHPNGPNKLDDLCGRYGIDNSRRTKHGALLDAEILADVYLEMIGARQAQLGLGQADAAGTGAGYRAVVAVRTVALAPRLSEAERSAHRAFVAKLGENALWRDYLEPDELPDANAA